MEALLETWLAGARLTEIAHLVMLAKVEFGQSRDQLTSVNSHKHDRPGRACQPRGETLVSVP